MSTDRVAAQLRLTIPLSVPRGAALYIGALLGPGLLLLPGLAAAQAGPASVLAWVALIIVSAMLATVFTALGRQVPRAGQNSGQESGVAGYTAAGLGRRAGAVAGWCFLAGVVCGAPIVCLIGAGYVADLTGGGQLMRVLLAGALLLAVLGLALGGVRASTLIQLVLVALLIIVVVIAVAGSAPSVHAANWAPFAPHGWGAIGRAASTLMLSFVGWEAVAPLTTRFRDPRRQLPRVTGIAFGVTTALYLGLAVATIGGLGRGAGTDVPLAALLQLAIGPAGRAAAAGAALVLTLGATNAYLSGAGEMIMQMRRSAGRGDTLRPGSRRPFLLVIGAVGLVLIVAYAVHLVSMAALVTLPTTMFLTVYLCCTASAARILAGPARIAAWPALIAVAGVLAFCGWALAAAAAVAAAALATRPGRPPTRAAVPQAVVPQAVVPQAVVPQAVVPQAVVPQAVVPQAVVPQAVVPQAVVPQAVVPQAAVPQAVVTPTRPAAPGRAA